MKCKSSLACCFVQYCIRKLSSYSKLLDEFLNEYVLIDALDKFKVLRDKLNDTIIFDLKDNLIDMKANLTKREALSLLASIYDPLGLGIPFVFI